MPPTYNVPDPTKHTYYYQALQRWYRTTPDGTTIGSATRYGTESFEFIDHYNVTGYRWVLGANRPEPFNEVFDRPSYSSGGSPPVWRSIPSPEADPIDYGIERVIAAFQGTYNGAPITIRARHAGSGNVVYEYDNPLRININPSDIQAVGVSVDGVTPPGQVTVRVLTANESSPPIDSNVSILGIVYPKGGTLPADSSPEWKKFVVNGDYYNAPFQREATYSFAIDAPGDYTCGVRVLYGTQPGAYPGLTQDFRVPQAAAASGTLRFSPLQPDPTATKLGQATGIITVKLEITGPSTLAAVVELTQDSRKWTEVIYNDHPAGNNPPYEAQFKQLPAGLYTLNTYLLNNAAIKDGPLKAQVPLPDLEIGDQLTFLPWVQPALTHAATGTGLRPTLALRATLQTDQNAGQSATVAATTAEIYGPGDVLGLHQRAVLATTPAPGALGCSPLQLAAIDFKEEDLPWRYSTLKIPGATPAADVPLPWCLLLVLEAGEYEAQPLAGRPLPSIKVKAGPDEPTRAYPSADVHQQKLWAHVQVNASLDGGPEINTFLNVTLPQSPDLAYSRVLCPRRLKPHTDYQAFLVPAVEAGRLAGLGLAFGPGDVQLSAIPDPATERLFPVYFQWQFATGTEDDFEALAAQLHPANAATRQAVAPSLSVQTAAGPYALPMPALLVDATAPPAPAAAAAQELAVAQYLYAALTPGRVGGRPVVTAPLYGRAYMVTTDLIAPVTAVAGSWKHTLNLDPRYRALAALGAQVVLDNQEEYVRRAWDQVQDILLANEKLRGAQYGLRTTAGLRDQHLPLTAVATAPTAPTAPGFATGRLAAPADHTTARSRAAVAPNDGTAPGSAGVGMADYGLHLTALALGRVRVSDATIAATAQANPQAPPLPRVTVREALRRSSTPLAAFSPAFRRIMKPFGHYQVGEAGRPLRPTQPEEPFDPTDLRQPGTSLRQRDALFSGLAQGTLAAAPRAPSRSGSPSSMTRWWTNF